MNTKSTQQIQTHTHTSDVFFFETNKRRTSNLLFLSFFLLVSLQYLTPKFIWNTKIYEENAVGATEKYTMYKPTAKNIRLCGGEIVCPTPTEELGIFAGNRVYPVAGPTIGDRRAPPLVISILSGGIIWSYSIPS